MRSVKRRHAGGRRGKKRAARNERSSDWRWGARSAPPTRSSYTRRSASAHGRFSFQVYLVSYLASFLQLWDW